MNHESSPSNYPGTQASSEKKLSRVGSESEIEPTAGAADLACRDLFDSQRPHTTTVRLILVEDESIVALNLRRRLTKLGYDVCAMAASGEAALEKIQLLKPDIVLMDIHIDGAIDGIETVNRIPPELHVGVVYLTAYSEDETLARAQLTKPYGYLLKPFSEGELHTSIQMALKRSNADREIRENQEHL